MELSLGGTLTVSNVCQTLPSHHLWTEAFQDVLGDWFSQIVRQLVSGIYLVYRYFPSLHIIPKVVKLHI